MRRRAIAIVATLGLALAAWAEVVTSNAVSVTSTSQTITFTNSRTDVLILNDGPNEIYVRVFTSEETAAAATTSHVKINTGESRGYSHNPRTESGRGYLAVALVCAAAETATARIESK